MLGEGSLFGEGTITLTERQKSFKPSIYWLLKTTFYCVFRVHLKNSIALIGPIAVDKNFQGRGIGKRLLDFAETFAVTTEVEVVSCRSDLFPMYERRGYKVVANEPITKFIPESHLTRLDLDFVIMHKSL